MITASSPFGTSISCTPPTGWPAFTSISALATSGSGGGSGFGSLFGLTAAPDPSSVVSVVVSADRGRRRAFVVTLAEDEEENHDDGDRHDDDPDSRTS